MPFKILNLKYGISLVTLLFLFSLLGINLYQGSYFYYFAFDITWLATLLMALCFSQSHVIFYIQLMLFLGFWVKFMAYLILDVALIEPTGYWTSKFANSASWDEVLLTSSLAACGVCFANLLFFLCTKNKAKKNSDSIGPQWYFKHKDLIWYLILTIGIVTNIINFFCHISVAGFRPQIILPFHLNALLLWIMVIAIPLSMTTFLGWEQNAEQRKRRFHYVCLMAFVTSLSILSRAMYLFWTLPFILILLFTSDFSLKKISLWQNKKTILIYLTFAISSLVLVNIIRINAYVNERTNITSIAQVETDLQLDFKKQASSTGEEFSQIKKLFVGRWVGLEAVMATTAFPYSSWMFFKESVFEKPSVGDLGVYTRKILKPYKFYNTPTSMFSSLPGLVGILNYANSNSLVFLGMLGVCFLFCCTELLVFLMMRNTFLLSQQALILSYWCISGLNIPYLGVINLLECLFVSLGLSLISPCYNWIMKYFNKDNLSLSGLV